MTTTIYTESICDRCGKMERRANASDCSLPEGWASFMYRLEEHEDIKYDKVKEICPQCAKIITSVLQEDKLAPPPEKKSRKRRSDWKGNPEQVENENAVGEPILFDIHIGVGDELHTMSYGNIKVQGKGLKETLALLEKAIESTYMYGYDWRATLTPQELERVNNIERSS